MTTQPTIGIIGGGNMGNCIVGGLIQKGYPAQAIILSDHHEARCQHITATWGVQTLPDNRPVAEQADLLILAVKPHSIANTLDALKPLFQKQSPTIISVAAGITTAQLQDWIGNQTTQVVRAMPNVPALIGHGITALFSPNILESNLKNNLSMIFDAIGESVWIDDETFMDIITALSGSGPAYFYALMESLIESACQLGLPAPLAQKLTIATALGSAYMAKANPDTIPELRQQVTSKGGTTEQALQVLEKGQFKQLIQSALEKATEHGKKLRATYD